MADYDAVIIGTGFGGSIAAQQLTERWSGKLPNRKILMLERGAWWQTPDPLGVPTNPPRLADYLTAKQEPVRYWSRPDHKEGLQYILEIVRGINGHVRNQSGLYNYFASEDVHILTANGVGGGSLIYSGVNKEPDQSRYNGWTIALDSPAFDSARKWMATNRGALSNIVTKIPSYQDFKQKWGSDLTNHEYLFLDRSRALKDAAKTMALPAGVTKEKDWEALDLSITEFDHDQDPSGSLTQHTFCERQGRCILGCLPAARHTLNKMIFKHFLSPNSSHPNVSIDVWSLTEALTVAVDGNAYRVEIADHGNKGRPASITSDRVFFAAGVLGTNHLLLKCRDRGLLALSPRLGYGFSTNGDFAGFAANTQKVVHDGRGPINTCAVTFSYSDGAAGRKLITVEDSGIPKMLAPLIKAGLEVLDRGVPGLLIDGLKSLWNIGKVPDLMQLLGGPNPADPQSFATEDQMLANVFFFNVMGVDASDGQFSLERDELKLKINTPPKDQATFQKTEDLLRALGSAMGGKYVPFPLWEGFGHKKLISTHPLGGCGIANERNQGVVNSKGQLFYAGGADNKAVYPGLYVVDGSIVPNALAVNPTLTITALVLKMMAQVQ